MVVHPKMKMLSSFTHPKVVPNLYEFLYSIKYTIYILYIYILKNIINQKVDGSH